MPTHYFHVVFTMPHTLARLCHRNAKQMYDLLFAAACRSLLELGQGRLGARLGVTAVLHTWTRDLRFHPHVHCVVTGGGLALTHDHWVTARRDYLVPVRALSRLYRGKLLAAVAAAYKRGELDLGGACRELADPATFARLKDRLYQVEWVVYAKRPFGGPEQVYRYLGRYTHRIAISNRRLVRFDADGVCVTTKNGKTVTLAPDEFIRRFLLHVLPKGYVRIRHFGLLSSTNATTKLAIARHLLEGGHGGSDNQMAVAGGRDKSDHAPILDWRVWFQQLTGTDLTTCPQCRGTMQRQPIPGTPVAPDRTRVPAWDTS